MEELQKLSKEKNKEELLKDVMKYKKAEIANHLVEILSEHEDVSKLKEENKLLKTELSKKTIKTINKAEPLYTYKKVSGDAEAVKQYEELQEQLEEMNQIAEEQSKLMEMFKVTVVEQVNDIEKLKNKNFNSVLLAITLTSVGWGLFTIGAIAANALGVLNVF